MSELSIRAFPGDVLLIGDAGRLLALAIAASLVAGCVGPSRQGPPPAAPVPAPRAYSLSGLESVIGSSASALVARLGRPDLELREGNARKLQYLGPACVLDIYLYPSRSGGEPVATHVDARLPDGREMDRSSCVATLLARRR